MLNLYEFKDLLIQQSSDIEAAKWIDLSQPSDEELGLVSECCELRKTFLAEPLDPKEHPRLEQDENSLMLLIRAPHFINEPDGGFFSHTVPVGIIIQPHKLISICQEAGFLEELLKSKFNQTRAWSPLLLTACIFKRSATKFIEALECLEEIALKAESSLKFRPENNVLLDILKIQKALIDITVALKSSQGILKTLRQEPVFGQNLSPSENNILNEALIETQQAIFTSEIFSQILSTMSDTFGSIISNNLNKIMKFMAAITIILMLPGIVAAFYGMNVALPGANSAYFFWAICLLCISLMLTLSIIFIRKKWF